ncbi:MAG TPA: Gfo/Idh/MocA family oxidoreductase, partial [Thermomicrobiales bacterium]|nr:Gfo/Idh/MocA family oxidoreductase [Thermomicrobiales bacterium]
GAGRGFDRNMTTSGFIPVGPDPNTPTVGIGLLGYNFMAKAHSNAYRTMPYMFWPPVAMPRLVAIAGRTEERVAEAARRYGYEGYYTSWEELVEDDRIDLFDNCSSHHMHVEPSIAALNAGKHVICEKPLALSASDAWRMVEAARASGKQHMTGFNYRFIPSIRLARQLIERGDLGELYQVRIQYLQQSLHDPDRPLGRIPEGDSSRVGSQLNLGSHATDLARFLVGELATVSALTPRFRDQRPGPGGAMIDLQWDDASISLVEFENGAVGTIEASRLATGRANSLRVEVNGSRGSIGFDLERLNELQVYLVDTVVSEVVGFQDVLVTRPDHPYAKVWWPGGHILGWEHAHINELHHFVEAIATGSGVAPYGATFEDGYRAAVIAEAIDVSAASGRKVEIAYAE